MKKAKIHHREFMVVLYVMSNGSAEENLRQIFRIFDINSDGTISQKELQKIVKDLFHLLKKDSDPQKESEVGLLMADALRSDQS